MDATEMAADVKDRPVACYTFVYCTFRVDMFHRWPDAPTQFEYLRARHRHEFHFKVTCGVSADRQMEFIHLKKMCLALVSQIRHENDTDTWSCEHWANVLLRMLPSCAMVEVAEDGENGAIACHSMFPRVAGGRIPCST